MSSVNDVDDINGGQGGRGVSDVRSPSGAGGADEPAPSRAPEDLSAPAPAGSTGRSVVVVGAGPSGLLLAGDLAEAGVHVTLVEKRAPGISNLSRAFALHARTLEQLDARASAATVDGHRTPSLADELVARGRTLASLRLFNLISVRLDTLASRFNFVLVLPQYEVEAVLQRRAVRAGVRFVYRTEVTGLVQDEGAGAGGGVTLQVRGPGGRQDTLRAGYVVGADGMRSAVRQAVDLPFPGKSVIRSVVLADVRLAEPPEDLLTINAAHGAFAFLVPFGDGYHRVIGWHRARDVPDDEPLELDEIKEITRLALGRDYGMYDARWMSRFHSDERQAPAYRAGRVFLAGDAAHVHTPAGGQGMNTGLQDAANLSWKLAAVLGGRASDSLLDTYQTERHPVGKAVLRSSGGIVRLAMAKRPWMLAARVVLGTVLRVLPLARRKAIGQLTGIGYAYPGGRGAHALAGRRMPDVRLAGGGRLYEALRGGRFVLIDPAGTDDGAYGARVAAVRWASERRTVVLVRPDGYVAWAAESPHGSALAAAVAKWAGTPVSNTP